jgi:Lsr2
VGKLFGKAFYMRKEEDKEMAQRVNVVLVDDIDGTDAAETVTFGLDGADYEIDLSEENADRLREAFALYIGHARETRRSGGGGRRRSAGGRSSRNGRAARSASTGGTSASEIRAWARENGFQVPDRGRIPGEVREAYESAH